MHLPKHPCGSHSHRFEGSRCSASHQDFAQRCSADVCFVWQFRFFRIWGRLFLLLSFRYQRASVQIIPGPGPRPSTLHYLRFEHLQPRKAHAAIRQSQGRTLVENDVTWDEPRASALLSVSLIRYDDSGAMPSRSNISFGRIDSTRLTRPNSMTCSQRQGDQAEPQVGSRWRFPWKAADALCVRGGCVQRCRIQLAGGATRKAGLRDMDHVYCPSPPSRLLPLNARGTLAPRTTTFACFYKAAASSLLHSSGWQRIGLVGGADCGEWCASQPVAEIYDSMHLEQSSLSTCQVSKVWTNWPAI